LDEISKEISSRRAEASRGQVLADHVTHALRAIAAKVDEAEERYPSHHSNAAKLAGARELRLYTHLVWGTHCSLLWLRAEEQVLLDLGALYFADELALDLLGSGVEVTPVESSDYMYSTSSWPFDWLGKELGEELPDGPRPVVLAFPAHAQHTMLLHCLFAHELSHPAVDERGLANAALEPLRESGAYQTVLDAAGDQTVEELRPLVEEEGPKLATLWLEELFCDALAFALLGPAYLFAFAEMGLSVGWSKSDDEHPSMALRTLLLVKFAKRHGWDAYLESRLPRIWEWLEFAGGGRSTVPAGIGSFAERICRNSDEVILDLAESAIGERLFAAAQWEYREAFFAELLDNDVIPAEDEDGVAAKHHEILLASWLQALDKHGGAPSAIPLAIAETDYHRFVAKALEMSTTLRLWAETEI
jgi:hypothetical protein